MAPMVAIFVVAVSVVLQFLSLVCVLSGGSSDDNLAMTTAMVMPAHTYRSKLVTRGQISHGKTVIALKTGSTFTAAFEPSTAAYRAPEQRMIDVKGAWSSWSEVARPSRSEVRVRPSYSAAACHMGKFMSRHAYG
eukprot:6182689-Pleurochrysis_carterae.AAC.1